MDEVKAYRCERCAKSPHIQPEVQDFVHCQQCGHGVWCDATVLTAQEILTIFNRTGWVVVPPWVEAEEGEDEQHLMNRIWQEEKRREAQHDTEIRAILSGPRSAADDVGADVGSAVLHDERSEAEQQA